jgi:predicted methyltransferase
MLDGRFAGVDSRRLVGVSIPEGAVAEVLSRLAGRNGNAISLSDSDEAQPAPAQQQQQQQQQQAMHAAPWQYQHKQQAPLGPPPAGLAAWQQQQLYDSIDLT